MLSRIRKGDMVKVIAGKYKGKTGRVLKLITSDDEKKQRVIVEGINMQVKNRKPTQENQAGSQEKREGSIHISNVMPIDPATSSHIGSKDEAKLVKGTRVGTKVLPDGKKVRVARGKDRSGDIIETKEA
ncbi:50S ribosomal protein L24 [Myxococcota bacterium]|nr:50S ribosomal protein L24 [Myxococcota bacterium]